MVAQIATATKKVNSLALIQTVSIASSEKKYGRFTYCPRPTPQRASFSLGADK